MIKREKIELTYGRKDRKTITIPNSAIDYLSIANVRLAKKYKNRSCTKFERIKICESLNLSLNKNAINEIGSFNLNQSEIENYFCIIMDNRRENENEKQCRTIKKTIRKNKKYSR